jgi:hypothetical protein
MGDSLPYTAGRVVRPFEIEEHPINVTEKLRVIQHHKSSKKIRITTEHH